MNLPIPYLEPRITMMMHYYLKFRALSASRVPKNLVFQFYNYAVTLTTRLMFVPEKTRLAKNVCVLVKFNSSKPNV